MRLYFATPRYDSAATMIQGYACGISNVLLSYANVQEKRGGFGFWIESRREHMKLYVAGNGKSKGSAQRDHDTGTRNRLLSYAFLKDWAKDEFEFWIDRRPQDVSVFLDSGAFSAHTLGRHIDLQEYCDYVKANRDALDAYAVLDVIGNLDATLRNLRYMRDQGLDPVAIYHAGREPVEVLRDTLEDHTGYVALGGMASERITREELRAKLDACWHVIERFWPVKVHGLGIMAQWALERYPWYSVDSSSAIVAAGMGRVTRYEGGQMVSRGWLEDVAATWDGLVADGVGRTEGKSKSAHEGRRVRNITAQLRLERYVTDLWTARGVSW